MKTLVASKFLIGLMLVLGVSFHAVAETASPFAEDALGPRDRRKVEFQENIKNYIEEGLNKNLKKPEIQVAVKVRWKIETRAAAAPMISLGNLEIQAPAASFASESRSMLESIAGVDISVFFPSWMNDESMEAYKTQAVNFIPLIAKAKINIWGFRNQQAPMTFKDYIDDPSFLKMAMMGSMFFLLVMVITLLFMDNPAPTRVIVQMPKERTEVKSRALMPVSNNVVPMGNAVRVPNEDDEDQT